jgi:hypothetical protein
VPVEEDDTNTDIATTDMTTKRRGEFRDRTANGHCKTTGDNSRKTRMWRTTRKLGPQRRNDTKAATRTDKDNDDA